METHDLLLETNHHLRKPFLKNKELSFEESIFEKRGMFEKKYSVLLKNIQKKFEFRLHIFDYI
jgi:hypothetical protein